MTRSNGNKVSATVSRYHGAIGLGRPAGNMTSVSQQPVDARAILLDQVFKGLLPDPDALRAFTAPNASINELRPSPFVRPLAGHSSSQLRTATSKSDPIPEVILKGINQISNPTVAMVISLNKLAGSTGVPQEVQLAFVPIPAGQTNEASGEEPSCIYAWKYLTLGPQMLLSQILQHKSYAFALLGQAYVQRSNCKPRLPAFLPISVDASLQLEDWIKTNDTGMQKKAESLTQRLRSPSSALRHVAWRNGFLVGVDVKSDSKFRCIIKFKEDSQDTRKPYTRTDIQVDATVTLGTVYAHDNKPITLTYLQKVIGRLTNGARIWYNENLGVGKMMYDISRQ